MTRVAVGGSGVFVGVGAGVQVGGYWITSMGVGSAEGRHAVKNGKARNSKTSERIVSYSTENEKYYKPVVNTRIFFLYKYLTGR